MADLDAMESEIEVLREQIETLQAHCRSLSKRLDNTWNAVEAIMEA